MVTAISKFLGDRNVLLTTLLVDVPTAAQSLASKQRRSTSPLQPVMSTATKPLRFKRADSKENCTSSEVNYLSDKYEYRGKHLTLLRFERALSQRPELISSRMPPKVQAQCSMSCQLHKSQIFGLYRNLLAPLLTW